MCRAINLRHQLSRVIVWLLTKAGACDLGFSKGLKYGKQIRRFVWFSWLFNIFVWVVGGLNYSKISNLGSRTYSNTFWIFFGASAKSPNLPPPRGPLFYHKNTSTNTRTIPKQLNKYFFTYLIISQTNPKCWKLSDIKKCKHNCSFLFYHIRVVHK